MLSPSVWADGDVDDLHALAVVEELLVLAGERRRRPGGHRRRRLRTGWSAHPIQRLLVRDDLGARAGAGADDGDAAPGDRRA